MISTEIYDFLTEILEILTEVFLISDVVNYRYQNLRDLH